MTLYSIRVPGAAGYRYTTFIEAFVDVAVASAEEDAGIATFPMVKGVAAPVKMDTNVCPTEACVP
jgi:hypothetical protein